MRYILLVLCVLCCSHTFCAEGITFDATEWNFGSVEERGGSVSHTFRLKNGSDKPVVITYVRTSCGCTTMEYPRQPILPDEEIDLGVVFDPEFRPGSFSKDIYVHTSFSMEPLVLTIRGQVNPRQLSLEEEFPHNLGGGVRISALYLTIANVKRGEMSLSCAEYINTTERPLEVEFRPREGSSSALKIYFDGGIAAGGRTMVEAGYLVEEDDIFGEVLRDTVDIYINGVRTGRSLFVRGEVGALDAR